MKGTPTSAGVPFRLPLSLFHSFTLSLFHRFTIRLQFGTTSPAAATFSAAVPGLPAFFT
jgi:hypothetical protein